MTITPARPRTAAARRTRRRGPSGPRHGRSAFVVRPAHIEPPPVPVEAPEPVPEVRSHRAPTRPSFLRAAALRCVLYLTPLSVAAAAAGPLARVAWPVPMATLLLGWATAQALTCLGVPVARRAGPAAAARRVGGGFAAAAGLWCALVWIAPAALLGGDRGPALVIGLGGLGTLAAITVALVTRAEAAVVVWSLPCWVLAASALAEPVIGRTAQVGTLLPAAIVVVLVRAFQPVVSGDPGRPHRCTPAELRRGGGYLMIGASQVVCLGLIRQVGPPDPAVPFWLPVLLAVPVLEALIGWHLGRLEAGPAANDADHRKHVRGVTLITLAGLAPPLGAGVTLALTAGQLPARSAAVVLGLAGGTLLSGIFAVTGLLAARGRTGLAASLAAAPPLITVAWSALPLPSSGPLPDTVAVLAATLLAGLLVVALTAHSAPTADDSRRTP